MKKFFHTVKTYIDSMVYASLQTKLAVASFIVGSVICITCVFWIPPPGEISTSAIQATGMFLVLAGAAAGIKVAFDLQSQKFSAQIESVLKKIDKHKEDELEDDEKTLF